MRQQDRMDRSNYSKTSIGLDLQSRCNGCNHIEILLDFHFQPRHSGRPPGDRLRFHSDYAELALCAQKCHTCCVFRQALLSRCRTTEEADALAEDTRHCPVYVCIKTTEPTAAPNQGESLAFKIEIRDHPDKSAVCNSSSTAVEPTNLPESPHSGYISRRIEIWLGYCLQNHSQSCSVLRWSSDNPTRLILILSESKLQLCSVKSPVKYAALSYSWGTRFLPEVESEIIQRGMTTNENANLRFESFPLSDLPSTLRDAITLFRRVGLSYAWIDSVCIIQDDLDDSDFKHEAPRMHHYYGNALFTLAVCSNSKATSPMLAPRLAFSRIAEPCHLRSRWLSLPSVSLTEMLHRAPLTKRAWTLQEEHLSPKTLYWAPNKIYWSCAAAQLTENTSRMPHPISSGAPGATPQGFLAACYRGTAESRHREWLSLATSSSLRDMSNTADRFPALSGLASRYQFSSPAPNAYLTGLWQSTLAHDLSWRVVRAVSPTQALDLNSALPSWSWVSLPLCYGIKYDMEEPARADGFEFLSCSVRDGTVLGDTRDDVHRACEG